MLPPAIILKSNQQHHVQDNLQQQQQQQPGYPVQQQQQQPYPQQQAYAQAMPMSGSTYSSGVPQYVQYQGSEAAPSYMQQQQQYAGGHAPYPQQQYTHNNVVYPQYPSQGQPQNAYAQQPSHASYSHAQQHPAATNMDSASNTNHFQAAGAGGGHYSLTPEGKPPIQSLDINLRHGFIRKVFGILTLQLIITFGMTFAFNLIPEAALFVRDNSWLVGIAVVTSIALMCVIVCNEKAARTVPYNYLLLFGFTISYGFLVALVGATVDTDTLTAAVGTTVLVTAGLILFACQTKYDFTGMGPYLFVIFIVLIVTGFISWWFPAVCWIYSGLGVLLFSAYLVMDVQMVVGGKNRKHVYGVDDYIIAALNIYVDIVQLFLFILQIFGRD